MVLAGGETSRLYKALVRDLRLAKDVSADDDTKEIAGLFTLAVHRGRGEVDRRDREGLREGDRPAEGRGSLARRAGPRAGPASRPGYYARLTRPIGRAITISTGFAQHDDPEHYRKEFARYFQVTPADVQRVARAIPRPTPR